MDPCRVVKSPINVCFICITSLAIAVMVESNTDRLFCISALTLLVISITVAFAEFFVLSTLPCIICPASSTMDSNFVPKRSISFSIGPVIAPNVPLSIL